MIFEPQWFLSLNSQNQSCMRHTEGIWSSFGLTNVGIICSRRTWCHLWKKCHQNNIDEDNRIKHVIPNTMTHIAWLRRAASLVNKGLLLWCKCQPAQWSGTNHQAPSNWAKRLVIDGDTITLLLRYCWLHQPGACCILGVEPETRFPKLMSVLRLRWKHRQRAK